MAAGTLEVVQTLQRVGGQLRFLPPKTEDSPRTVPLPDFCLQALKEHAERQADEHDEPGTSGEITVWSSPRGPERRWSRTTFAGVGAASKRGGPRPHHSHGRGSPRRWILGEHPYCDPPIPVRRGRGGRADLPEGGWARGLFAPVLAFPDHDRDGKPVWAGDAVAWAVRSSRGSGRAGLLRGGWRRRAWRLPRRGDARGRRCRPALAVKPLAAAALTRTRAVSARRLSRGVSARIRAPQKSMATSRAGLKRQPRPAGAGINP